MKEPAMDYNRSVTDLNATVVSASGFQPGDIIPFKTASQSGTVAGCLLTVGTFRFVVSSPSGDSETPAQTSLLAVQVAWVAAVASTITVKTCNFPGFLDKFGRGAVDVSDFDTTYWLLHNPTTAYVPVSGAGNSASNMTVTTGGTALGTCIFELGNVGDRRLAIDIVTTVGGIVRCNACGKLGS